MMKRTLLLIAVLLSTLTAAQAQTTIKYGTVNVDSLLRTLPDYAQAEEQMARLRKQYEAVHFAVNTPNSWKDNRRLLPTSCKSDKPTYSSRSNEAWLFASKPTPCFKPLMCSSCAP